MASKTFRFKKNITIGALAAEEDAAFLKDCFVDTGLMNSIRDMSDFRRIILGRTGAGKSALFIHLAEMSETIVISPDELAIGHLCNSDLLNQLNDTGISLLPLYKLLWKHVFVVEVLRARHQQLREGESAPGFWRNLLNSFSKNAKEQTNKEALQYLSQYGDNFWQTTEYRVKEITEKVEQQIKADIGAQLGPGKFGVGGSKGSSTEMKSALEQVGKDFVKAIQIKKLTEAVKWLAEDTEGQPPLFIIIDGLDEDWAEMGLRYELIRALIDTAREFKVVGNVKILIALREDLFESVLTHTSEAGFQREKYMQLCHELRWTRDELKAVVETRVNKLIRDAYTTSKVRIDDLMEPVIGVPGVQYLIDRTLLRPRDIIAFFNQCIKQTADNPKITRHIILAAEPGYSTGRLAALADEWKAVEPLTSQAAELLRGRKSNLRVREITEDQITEFSQTLYMNHWSEKSPIGEMAKKHCEHPDDMSADAVRRAFVNFFYKIGLIGVKPVAQEKYHWSSEGPPTMEHLEVTENCGIRIHKAFWRALNIVAPTGASEE